MEQKNPRIFLVFKIIAFGVWSTNSQNPEEDTCYRQSICYQAVVRVKISLKEIFSKSCFLRVMKKRDESTLMHILEEYGTL